jgi:hypothetical protein
MDPPPPSAGSGLDLTEDVIERGLDFLFFVLLVFQRGV